MKKLYKSKDDVVFYGILGGIGEYYEIDATILRLVFLALLLITGIFPGVILYIIACLIVPNKPIIAERHDPVTPTPPTDENTDGELKKPVWPNVEQITNKELNQKDLIITVEKSNEDKDKKSSIDEFLDKNEAYLDDLLD